MSDPRQTFEREALTVATDGLADNLRDTATRLAHLRDLKLDYAIPYMLSVPDRADIAKTGGNGIAYCCLGNNAPGRAVRTVFDDLVVELEGRMR